MPTPIPMPDPIPMLDLGDQVHELFDELQSAVERVLRSGRFILGPEVEGFEAEAAAYLGVEHAVGLASGTDALVIGLRSLGIQPGDEVITSPFTFFATAEAIRNIGAVPVFADIEPDTFCLSPDSVAEKITPRTRALVPVHLYGHPAQIDALERLASQHSIVTLEDAAQAFGSEWDSQRVGSFGKAAAFSFFPSKNLGAFGDGGLLATSESAVAERARRLRNHGQVDRYHYAELGYTARLDEIQAAVLRIKLPHLDRWNAGRRRVASHYSKRLSCIPGIAPPCERAPGMHVYHQYTIRVRDGQRDRLQAALQEAGIASVVYYPVPLHTLTLFGEHTPALPEAERAAREVLSLPIWPELTEERQDQICDVIAKAMGAQA